MCNHLTLGTSFCGVPSDQLKASALQGVALCANVDPCSGQAISVESSRRAEGHGDVANPMP